MEKDKEKEKEGERRLRKRQTERQRLSSLIYDSSSFLVVNFLSGDITYVLQLESYPSLKIRPTVT